MTDKTQIGITRHIDEIGRVVIPKEIRAKLGILPETPFTVSITEDGGILLQRQRSDDVVLGLFSALNFNFIGTDLFAKLYALEQEYRAGVERSREV